MVFYGQEVIKSSILRYIENFVMLKFVTSRFNCNRKKKKLQDKTKTLLYGRRTLSDGNTECRCKATHLLQCTEV